MASGTQVRKEDFGLLFYTMKGPRLYFLSSGSVLDTTFFQGKCTPDEWITNNAKGKATLKRVRDQIKNSLEHLRDKGVIVEC